MAINKIKLKIGEFSKLNQVTVKTLRHYEEIGLLIPFEIDEWTGYRYYNVDQMSVMNRIIYLKRLGFSLDEIKDMFEDGVTTPTYEMIEAKLNLCLEEQKVLSQRQYELNELKNHLKIKNKMENITIKSLPAVIVASHRRIVNSYQELFYLCPNVIGPEMARLGCVCTEPGYCFTVEHDKEYRESEIDMEYFEAVTEKKQDSDLIKFKELAAVPEAICYSHYGPYDKFPQSWEELYKYLEANDYVIADFPRFCYIDGVWNKENPEEWLTEIQVPVSKK